MGTANGGTAGRVIGAGRGIRAGSAVGARCDGSDGRGIGAGGGIRAGGAVGAHGGGSDGRSVGAGGGIRAGAAVGGIRERVWVHRWCQGLRVEAGSGAGVRRCLHGQCGCQ